MVSPVQWGLYVPPLSLFRNQERDIILDMLDYYQ